MSQTTPSSSSIESDSGQVILPPTPSQIWDKHKQQILGSAVVLILIAVSAIGFWYAGYQSEVQASKLYAKAEKPADWQAVIDEYPGSSAAAMALLDLAYHELGQNNADGALQHYQTFQKKFPKHPLAPSVKFAEATCLDILDKNAEAREIYLQISQDSTHPCFAPASLRLAALYQTEDNIPNARQTLEQLLQQRPMSAFRSDAQVSVSHLP